MEFIKPFYGCCDGEIYPVWFAAGDVCPPELESAAIEVGAVQAVEVAPKAKKGPSANANPDD